MKSLRKKILASALAITLVGGVFAPKANAEDKAATKEQIWEKLNITKIVNKVENGVTTPDVEFEFAFKPEKQDDPTIPNAKIKFDAQDDEDKDDTTPGKQIIKTIPIDLSNIEWKRTGEHIYTLTEVLPKNKVKDMMYAVPDANKQIYKDYEVKFYVEEKEGKLQASKITVVGITKGGKGRIKLNYDDTIGVKFLNKYNKKDGNENPGGGTEITDPDKKGFAFKKIVANGTEEDNNKEFVFTVKVDKAVGSTLGNNERISYCIVDENGTKGAVQTADYGTEFSVNLKHNQRVVFTDVILGSNVSVKEKDSKGLTPSVEGSLLEAQKEQKSITGIIGDDNGGNFAEITNKKTVITGVLIDNLPYIALVAVAGLGIFFFVKNRREEEIYA